MVSLYDDEDYDDEDDEDHTLRAKPDVILKLPKSPDKISPIDTPKIALQPDEELVVVNDPNTKTSKK